MYAVVILCGVDTILRKFMLTAAEMGMTNGDFVYIYITEVVTAPLLKRWIANDTFDDVAKQAYLSLIQVKTYNKLCIMCVNTTLTYAHAQTHIHT